MSYRYRRSLEKKIIDLSNEIRIENMQTDMEDYKKVNVRKLKMRLMRVNKQIMDFDKKIAALKRRSR